MRGAKLPLVSRGREVLGRTVNIKILNGADGLLCWG